jgi:hypothetical protein
MSTSTKEPQESVRDRQDSAVSKLRAIAESLAYCPPEGVAAYLFRAQRMLNHHFAESIARANVPYVAGILRQIEARRRNDPEFAAALREAMEQEPRHGGT